MTVESEAALDVAELCRREGYASRSYAEGAVILADEVDALVCARALRKKGHVVTVTGLILEVDAGKAGHGCHQPMMPQCEHDHYGEFLTRWQR